uniref:Uncharacterized protein n=1 Tax=Ditylenchus dipsaci TaxID=166011 RepID=A0A915E242_9BILA
MRKLSKYLKRVGRLMGINAADYSYASGFTKSRLCQISPNRSLLVFCLQSVLDYDRRVQMSYMKSSLLQKISLVRVKCMKQYSVFALPFKIPEPIERSPTDLLKELARKVREDPTAPRYGIHDDPVFISEFGVRQEKHFLTREYGKLAARKLVEEWPTLFMFDRDQPRLPAFRPMKPVDASIIKADQKNLIKLISEKQVEQAAKLYERMCEMNKPISKEVQLDLFRLLAYYNAQKVPLHEQKERPAARASYHKQKQKRQEVGNSGSTLRRAGKNGRSLFHHDLSSLEPKITESNA